MSFHPDVISLEPFTPHVFSDLVAMRAFPEGALPEPAYKKMVAEYEASGVIVQRISYLSDHLNINGLIAAPEGKAKGIVIYNRGGSGNYGILTVHAIIRQFIPLVRAGYVVMGANYRGNDGGEGKDEFGGRDVDDVLALHTIVKAHPNASPATYLVGHSRGGMMAFLMQRRGFKSNACVAIAPVCDVRDWPKLNADIREDRSVLAWPEKLTAPTLILHGTKDEAIPHEQSEKLAAALSSLGKPHQLVLYEGGNHALTRNWEDVMRRTIGWFEHYA